jgi:hypothetical protein
VVDIQASSLLAKFANEEQDPAVVEQVHSKVSQILTSGEEIIYIAVQKKLVMNMSPVCVALTNKRFIIYKPKMLGRVDFEDYIWRDLKDAKVKEGMRGATLTLETMDSRQIPIEDLPKAQARKLYTLAQDMEEHVREERRQRELEEKRAAAGGIVMSTPAAQQPAPVQENPVQKLKQLKDMLDAGLISQGEYDSKKVDILSRM